MKEQDQREPAGENDEHIVTLQDENGNDITFDHLLTLEFEGANYILLEAQQDMEDCLQGESIILKIEQDENGDDLYATIEDEEEYQRVFQKCLEVLEEQGDGEEN
ncbi:MAG: DUF1292 domain-containing protein [Eubacteriales bacterium]|nr:DUF1292 domain-containing protein [Eubacteriales bacterium]MDD3213808.1 DUF1292 domain-containing protein [Eubacteriales bacterium]